MTTLRRTLGETRTKERAAREDAEAARSRAEEDVTRLERELRQARSQITRFEEEAGEQRRSERTDRDEATVRARLLLDTLGDAVAGLRRELALPPSSSTPGERTEEAYADEGPAAPGPPLVQDPARLAQYLALPRPRLIVDGYNVTKAAWPTQSLEAQRTRLLTLLGALVARTGAETTVVFDGPAATPGRRGGAPRREGALQPGGRDRRRRHPRPGRRRAGGPGAGRGHRRPRAGRRRTPRRRPTWRGPALLAG